MGAPNVSPFTEFAPGIGEVKQYSLSELVFIVWMGVGTHEIPDPETVPLGTVFIACITESTADTLITCPTPAKFRYNTNITLTNGIQDPGVGPIILQAFPTFWRGGKT